MRIYIPNDDKVRTIPLGRCGENIVTELAFDVAAWLSDHGSNSTIRLMLQRSQDDAAYPCMMTIDGIYAVYTLTSADTEYVGTGRAELRLTNGSKVAKSRIFSTIVTTSLDDSEDTPSPWQSWMDAFEELVERAEDAAEDAEAIAEALAAVSASASVNNAYGTPAVVVTKTLEDEGEETEHYNFDFAFSNLKGKGIQSISKTGTSGLVDTYTITYDGGTTTTFTVTNGNGIQSIAKTGTSGLVDTYTITYDNGTTTTFQVTNGNGIASAVLNADYTLTLTFTNGTSYTTPSIRGEKGEKGNVNFATFEISASTGILTMNTTADYSGANFQLNGANLEVVI